MSPSHARFESEHEPSVAADIARGTLLLVWQVVRLPIFAFLVILEPIVRVALVGAALLVMLTAFFFKFFTEVPNFPFWGMLGVSVGCALLLMAYYVLLRLFSR